MNWVDLLIVAVIAWSAFRGFSTGLIRQAVWLIAVVLGVVLAGFLYDDLSANLDFLLEDGATRNLIAFAAIVGGVVVAGGVAGAVLKTAANVLFLGPLDSVGGAVLGFVRGVIVVQVALILLAVFPAQETLSRAVADSTIAPFFLEDLPAVGLPSEFSDPLERLDAWRRRAGAMLPDWVPDGVADAVPVGGGR